MGSRVVLVTRRLEMFIGDPEGATTVVLLPDGTAEPLPDALAGADDAAIATQYGVDEVVRPPDLPWCRGVIVDGPDAGQEVYTVRRVGSSVIARAGTYRVIDEGPEIVPLRLAAEESGR